MAGFGNVADRGAELPDERRRGAVSLDFRQLRAGCCAAEIDDPYKTPAELARTLLRPDDLARTRQRETAVRAKFTGPPHRRRDARRVRSDFDPVPRQSLRATILTGKKDEAVETKVPGQIHLPRESGRGTRPARRGRKSGGIAIGQAGGRGVSLHGGTGGNSFVQRDIWTTERFVFS